MLMRRLYTLLFYLLLPAVVLRLLYRSLRAPDYRRRWGERFGRIAAVPAGAPVCWLHAVSVGETLAAVPLARALLAGATPLRLMITTTTPTGSAQVRQVFAREISDGRVLHVYAPYDIPCALEAFIARVQPTQLIIMETELWPNMIHVCHTHKIPVVLANARLSQKSARGYQRLRVFTTTMLQELTAVAVQNATDGQRFLDLGFAREKLTITGSIKFDLELTAAVREKAAILQREWSAQSTRLVWLAASTHQGEDDIVLNVFNNLKKAFPSLRLILVPRHPERFNAVFEQCTARGLRTQRRSDTKLLTADIDVILGDTMGELLAFYGACDIAFVGGSFVDVGGHNLIEPAAWAKPILTGKYLHNFVEVSALLVSEQALLICEDQAALERDMLSLLRDTSQRSQLGKNAQRVTDQNRGALQKLLAVLAVGAQRHG